MKKNRRRRSPQGQWLTTRRLVVLAVLVTAALVAAFVFDDMGLTKYLAMRKQARQLEREIQAFEVSNAALSKEVDRVQHDPARIEELARDRLGLVREGEQVYQVIEKPEQ